MLSRREVGRIFADECNAANLTGVQIVDVPLRDFIESSLASQFIRTQVLVGIYDETNIYEDFLSYARSFVAANVIQLCYELIEKHAEGVPDDVTRDYLRYVARHEVHHFGQNHRPQSTSEHLHAELGAIAAQDTLIEEAWMSQSPAALRVMARIEQIKKGLANA